MIRKRAEIEKEIAATERLMAPLQKRLLELQQELYEALIRECNVKVGDIVLAHRPGRYIDMTKEDAIVRKIEPTSSNEKPWLVVSFPRKSGEWSERRHNAYSYWEKKG